ncbi:MAG: acetyl-CoA carboxylase biotin carboxylase subunit [Fimbriimonadales bacterium]
MKWVKLSLFMKRIKKLLVANRGEIACRVIRTADEMGLQATAVYTEHDEGMPHMTGREAVSISTYLAMDEVIDAAKASGADAIHPGYGFLAENPEFARKCAAAGVVFIGPSPEAIEAVGDKSKARDQARKLGIPFTEGLGPFTKVADVEKAAAKLGAPLMLKAAAGGGGKGMKKLLTLEGLREQVETSQRETRAAFGDDRLIVERYIYPARHVEVQIFGDGKRAIALGERECSLQRRHQKLIEESPSTAVDDVLRDQLFDAAIRIAEAVGYKNAGTVEFLLGPDGEFYFLEVNARLQVEHPVTEMCTGLDLVRMQIEIAQGEKMKKQADVKREGHAIEARINAEDPYNNFLPSAGEVLRADFPEFPDEARVDSGLGSRVSTEYDSLIAKLIAHANTRKKATENLICSLQSTIIHGIYTNQAFLIHLLESTSFSKGLTFTSTVDEIEIGPRPLAVELGGAAAWVLRGPTNQATGIWCHSAWRLS